MAKGISRCIYDFGRWDGTCSNGVSLTTEQHWTTNSIGLQTAFVISHGQARKQDLSVILEGPCTNLSLRGIFALTGWGLGQAYGDRGYRKEVAITNTNPFIHSFEPVYET